MQSMQRERGGGGKEADHPGGATLSRLCLVPSDGGYGSLRVRTIPPVPAGTQRTPPSRSGHGGEGCRVRAACHACQCNPVIVGLSPCQLAGWHRTLLRRGANLARGPDDRMEAGGRGPPCTNLERVRAKAFAFSRNSRNIVKLQTLPSFLIVSNLGRGLSVSTFLATPSPTPTSALKTFLSTKYRESVDC